MGLRPEARNGSNYVMAWILFLNAPPFWAHPHFAPSLLLGPEKDALFGALDAETEIISFSFGADGARSALACTWAAPRVRARLRAEAPGQ